jgi:hypothetical protein
MNTTSIRSSNAHAMRASLAAIAFLLASTLLSVPSDAQPAPRPGLVPKRQPMVKALPPAPPQLLSWFSFTDSLDDRIAPPPSAPRRVVTVGASSTFDPTRQFIKVDARHDRATQVKVSRSGPEFVLQEFTASLWYYIEYLYPSNSCVNHRSMQTVLSHRAFDVGFNTCPVSGAVMTVNGLQFPKFPTPQVWTHIAVTRTPSDTKLYLNGALLGSGASRPLPENVGSYEAVYLGTTLYGSVDEFRFYSGALDAEAIAAIHKDGPSTAPPNAAIPIKPVAK